MIKDPDRLYRVACCILSSAEQLFEQHDVPWFARAGVTGKGSGDWECSTCSGIFVWLDDSNAVFDTDGRCVKSREYRFTIETGRCVNETIADKACDPDWYGGCETGPNGCPEPDIVGRIEEPCGTKDVKPHEEAAFLWRDRTVIESCLADQVACCLLECVGLRCEAVTLDGVTQAVEGGCAFVTYELVVTI